MANEKLNSNSSDQLKQNLNLFKKSVKKVYSPLMHFDKIDEKMNKIYSMGQELSPKNEK